MTIDAKDLDRLIPLANGRHEDVTGIVIDIPMRQAECRLTLADGTTTRLKNRRQLIGWTQDAARRCYFFRAGRRLLRIRTGRRDRIRGCDEWSAFELCQALSGDEPAVTALGERVHRVVSPDGSLAFIAPVQAETAREPRRIPEAARAAVSLAT